MDGYQIGDTFHDTQLQQKSEKKVQQTSPRRVLFSNDSSFEKQSVKTSLNGDTNYAPDSLARSSR